MKDRNFPLNRATGTYRSPGSSIKPLASYGPAVDTGLITPTTLVNDQAGLHLERHGLVPRERQQRILRRGDHLSGAAILAEHRRGADSG